VQWFRNCRCSASVFRLCSPLLLSLAKQILVFPFTLSVFYILIWRSINFSPVHGVLSHAHVSLHVSFIFEIHCTYIYIKYNNRYIYFFLLMSNVRYFNQFKIYFQVTIILLLMFKVKFHILEIKIFIIFAKYLSYSYTSRKSNIILSLNFLNFCLISICCFWGYA